jgi:chromatin remodeling complex protein RSC6
MFGMTQLEIELPENMIEMLKIIKKHLISINVKYAEDEIEMSHVIGACILHVYKKIKDNQPLEMH